jgi:probable rRNA maturation factor
LTSSPAPEISLINQSGLNIPVDENIVTSIVRAVSEGENVTFRFIEVVFVDEAAITRINETWLGKSYVTDIITFPYSPAGSTVDIEVTLTCCAQRISEQSEEFGTGLKAEFARVIVHGLLHVSGYDDTDSHKAGMMKMRENYYLDLLNLNI